MSSSNIGMSRYFGLVPSLYDFLDRKAVALLEIAITNRELGFHSKALSIFKHGLEDWHNVPIVVYEHAQTFLGQDKFKDAYQILFPYIDSVDGDALDQPEMRLLALCLGFVEIYHKGRIDRAVKEVNRTRQWLKDVSVDRYTDVQIAILARFLVTERHIYMLSNESELSNAMIPKSSRSRKPWEGLVDIQTILLETNRLDEACHLALSQNERQSTTSALIEKRREIITHFPTLEAEDAVLRKKIVLLEIKLRTSIATKLCELKDFEQAETEFSIVDERISALGEVFGLDEEAVSKTSLMFALRFAKLDILPTDTFEHSVHKYVESMGLLKDSEEACHSRLIQCFLQAADSLKAMYQQTGDVQWRNAMEALIERKEDFQLDVLGDIFAPLMAHQFYLPDYDLGLMPHEDIRLLILWWYDNYERQHPEFALPRIALQVAQFKARLFTTLGNTSRLEQTKVEIQELESQLKPKPGREVWYNWDIEGSSELDHDQDSLPNFDEAAARDSGAYNNLGLNLLGELFKEMQKGWLPDANHNSGFAGQELLVQWLKSDVSLGILTHEEVKTLFDDYDSAPPISNEGLSRSSLDVQELLGDDIAERLFGPFDCPISLALWTRRGAVLKDWLRRPSPVEQIYKDFVLLQLYSFRSQQLVKFGADILIASVGGSDKGFWNFWESFVLPCFKACKDCIAIIDEIHPNLRSHQMVILKKMELKRTLCDLVATGIGTGDFLKSPGGGLDSEEDADQKIKEELDRISELFESANFDKEYMERVVTEEMKKNAEKKREISKRSVSDWAVKIEFLSHSDDIKDMLTEACETCREQINYYEAEADSWERVATYQMLRAWMLLFKVRLRMASDPDQEQDWLTEGLELLDQAHNRTSAGLRRRHGGNVLASMASKEDYQFINRTALIPSTALNLLWDKGHFDQQDSESIWKWVQRSKAKALNSLMHLGESERMEGPGTMDESQLTMADLEWIAKMSGDSVVFVDWFSVPIFPGDPYSRLFISIAKPGERPIIEDLGMTSGDLSVWKGIKMPSIRWSRLQQIAREYNGGTEMEDSMRDAREKSALLELVDLVKPLSKHTSPGDLLVFSPSEYLHQVPLHALELPNDRPDISLQERPDITLHELSEARDRLVLIHRNPIVYCYSLSVLRHNFRQAFGAKSIKKPMHPGEVAIFGDIAGNAEHEDPRNFQAGRESAHELGDWFQTKPYLAKDATKSRFFAKAPTASLIHVHTHVDSSDPNPLAHSIVLSPEGRSSTLTAMPANIRRDPWGEIIAGDISSHAAYLEMLNNKKLTAGEINSLVELKSPCHVTIIACSGGRLRTDQGDEVMGLIPAFMIKGATSVVGTLWQTRDDVGAEFTKRFYRFFGKQDSNGLVDLARAFQSAIVSMDAGAVEPPDLWAEFVLYGCWEYRSPAMTQAYDHPWKEPL